MDMYLCYTQRGEVLSLHREHWLHCCCCAASFLV